VTIWTPKQRPIKEPNFHQTESLLGAGKSQRALFKILTKGWCLRKGDTKNKDVEFYLQQRTDRPIL